MTVLGAKNAKVGPGDVKLSPSPAEGFMSWYQGLWFISLRAKGKVQEAASEDPVTATQHIPGVTTGPGIPVLTHTAKEMEGKVAEEKMFL